MQDILFVVQTLRLHALLSFACFGQIFCIRLDTVWSELHFTRVVLIPQKFDRFLYYNTYDLKNTRAKSWKIRKVCRLVSMRSKFAQNLRYTGQRANEGIGMVDGEADRNANSKSSRSMHRAQNRPGPALISKVKPTEGEPRIYTL